MKFKKNNLYKVISVPIVVRHIALEEFADLPICWIDRWEEVTPEFLQSEFARITETKWNLEKLTFGYWKARIEMCAGNNQS